jgi:hypothetical protein
MEPKPIMTIGPLMRPYTGWHLPIPRTSFISVPSEKTSDLPHQTGKDASHQKF